MKHASDSALDQLDDLLEAIRRVPGLVEKKRGIFYRASKAFLHFHEDPAGLFADLRPGAEWLRLPVNTPEDREAVVDMVRGA
jgi:hypothetical protein